MQVAPITTPVRPGTYDVHVVPHIRGWAVEVEGANWWHAFTTTQAEAIGEGIRLARESAATLLIHGRDGKIREVWHYG